MGITFYKSSDADCRSMEKFHIECKINHSISLILFNHLFHASQLLLGECFKHRGGMFQSFDPYV